MPGFAPNCLIVFSMGWLLKLGIAIGQTSVAKYMAQRREPPLCPCARRSCYF